MANSTVNINMQDLQATLASFEQRFLANEQRLQQHEELLNRLAKLEKEKSQLNEKIFSLEDENLRLRQALQSQKSAPPNSNPTRGEIVPASQNNLTAQISRSTDANVTKPSKSEPHWIEVVSRRRSQAVKQKKAPSPKKIAAIARGFSAAAPGPQGFTYVYLSRSRRYTHNQVREDLRALGAEPNRVLDISFPSKSTIGLLVHVQYEAELTTMLSKAGVTPVKDFDPTAAQHIGDPALTSTLSAAELEEKALQLHRDRCIHALNFMARSRRPAMPIAKDFLSMGWISEEDLTDWMERCQGPAPSHSDAPRANAYRAAAAGFTAAGLGETDELNRYLEESADGMQVDTDHDQ